MNLNSLPAVRWAQSSCSLLGGEVGRVSGLASPLCELLTCATCAEVRILPMAAQGGSEKPSKKVRE